VKSSVYYAFVFFGVLFEILVMGCDYAETAVPVELFKEGFRQRASDQRLGATSELVDE
jgi:hypothetical protein